MIPVHKRLEQIISASDNMGWNVYIGAEMRPRTQPPKSQYGNNTIIVIHRFEFNTEMH